MGACGEEPCTVRSWHPSAEGDLVSFCHSLSLLHKSLDDVAVDSFVPIVVQDSERVVPNAVLVVYIYDCSICRGNNSGSLLYWNIDRIMIDAKFLKILIVVGVCRNAIRSLYWPCVESAVSPLSTATLCPSDSQRAFND